MALPLSSVIQASVALHQWELTTACATGRQRPTFTSLHHLATHLSLTSNTVCWLYNLHTPKPLPSRSVMGGPAAPHCHLPSPVYDHRLYHPHEDVRQLGLRARPYSAAAAAPLARPLVNLIRFLIPLTNALRFNVQKDL
ncbi:hypothetical protein B0H14DRAFT_3519301 [Mycena olivaceomarginata]|nr:hypothetical protein B0H14DRAFT_3519301 [Mycena olivaceomarginata]